MERIPGVVAQVFSPRIKKAEAGGSSELKTSLYRSIQGYPSLHRETLFKKKKTNKQKLYRGTYYKWYRRVFFLCVAFIGQIKKLPWLFDRTEFR